MNLIISLSRIPGVVLDSSGKGNHGVIRTAPNAADGPTVLDPGSGATGGASDRSVFLNDNGDIYLPTVSNGADPGSFDTIIQNQEMTISFWVKPPVAETHKNSFWGWLNPGRSSSIAPWSNNNMYWDTGGCCAGDQRLNGPIDPPDGEWHHWAFSRNEFGDKLIYLDGELLYDAFEQDAELLGPSDGAPQEYSIGSELTAADPINYALAEFDDYAIWDEALDEDDILALYSDGVRSVVPGLPEVPEGPTLADPPTSRLVNLDGQLGGATFLDGDGVISWHVEEILTLTADDADNKIVVDLTQFNVLGNGNAGDASTNVVLGNVPLTNSGADDITRTFRLTTQYEDTFLGVTSNTIEQDIVIAGSGGGVDPFVLLGDISQNDAVDFADFLILSGNFGLLKDAGTEIAPEPSSIGMCLLAGLMLGWTRKRR